MRRRDAMMGLLATMTVVAIGWHLFGLSPTKVAHVDKILRASKLFELKIEPKKDVSKIPLLAHSQPVAAQNKTLYEQFKEQKECFENADTPATILQDISALQTDLPRASGESKTILENAIRYKQAQLSILSKCGNTPVTKDELSRLLERAARQGDTAAQLAYALDPMIDPSHFIENLDRLRAWRHSALAYVQSAVDRGNSEAMIALAGAYDPFHCQASNKPYCPGMMLGATVDSNAEAAYRYYAQVKLTGSAPAWVDAEMKTLEQYLTPDQIAAAREAAASAPTGRQ